MRNTILSIFSIIAFLVVPFAPVFADDSPPIQDTTTSSDTSQTENVASTTDQIIDTSVASF